MRGNFKALLERERAGGKKKKSGLSLKLRWPQNCKLIHIFFRMVREKKRRKEKQVGCTDGGFLYLAGRTGRPEGRSSPWSCSEGTVPSQHASGHPTIGAATRRSPAVRGNRTGASEAACTLEKDGETPSQTILHPGAGNPPKTGSCAVKNECFTASYFTQLVQKHSLWSDCA